MKYAMTMDGKIACYTGKSQWITDEAARENVHHDRLKHMGIMVGVGTVLADNPMLTCRIEGGKHPVRIICDTNLRTPIDSNIVCTAKEIPTIIACSKGDTAEFEAMGCQIVKVPEKDGYVDLKQLMVILGRDYKIDSILLEGGGQLNWSAMKSGIVSKVQAYIAPKIFGGKGAPTAVSGIGAASPDECVMLYDRQIKTIGDDILIESRVKNVHGNN